MSTKSREYLFGSTVRAKSEEAARARKSADGLTCETWNARMLGFRGPAQPSPAIGDALNSGYGYLEVKCLGCNTHQTVALDIIRRPKTMPVHELVRALHAVQGLFRSGPLPPLPKCGQATGTEDMCNL
jgi:hypothetical protein